MSQNFQQLFQPIYQLWGWQRMGFEVFIRSEVRHKLHAYELDCTSIEQALQTYQVANFFNREKKLLFLNILPSTILHPEFPLFIKQVIHKYRMKNKQIVLEFPESNLQDSFDLLKSRVQKLKEQGFMIAVNQMGETSIHIKAILELDPNYLKLHRSLAANLHQSKQKQAIIKLFLSYCKQKECHLIIDGLTSEMNVATAKAIGMQYGQGSILGQPSLKQEIV